jgi:rRNA maturation endonuclease Nob1
MEVFLVAAALLGLGFAGIAIKIWAKKDGEFSGTCASNSPFLNEEGKACSFCGAAPQDKCKKDESSEPRIATESL